MTVSPFFVYEPLDAEAHDALSADVLPKWSLVGDLGGDGFSAASGPR
jgi:hypothetical protein